MTEEDGPLDYRPQTILTFDIAGVLPLLPKAIESNVFVLCCFWSPVCDDVILLVDWQFVTGIACFASAGNAKHDNAADHAEEQYLFVEDKRRKVSDQNAENQFLSDLHSTVKTVAAKRRKNRL